jgi:ATP-dependent 26S proteasome regulatory subunit
MSIEDAKATVEQMATREFTLDMKALIRSRTPLIYLVSTEERRVLSYFKAFSQASSYKTLIWDFYNGLLDISNNRPAGLVSGPSTDPIAVLDWILKEAGDDSKLPGKDTSIRATLYLMLDFHRFLQPSCTPDIERRLRVFHRMDSNSNIILVGPHFASTPALEKCISVIDFPYPNREELKSTLYSVITPVITKAPNIKQETEKAESALIDAVTGLTLPEAESAFAKSVVMHKKLDIPTILREKQQIIRKTNILEFFISDVGMDHVGGLGNLRDWLKQRKMAFTAEASNYGISRPKGILLIGVPGAGKSLAAKAAAKFYEFPLLRLDFGSLFNSLVGESERTARNAIRIAEAIAPCILWCDEIEKGLSGLRSSGQSDSGTTSRVIATFLTWMQEKKSDVFIICTANQHESLPTEFLRAGRFDEVFFVDLPSPSERVEIFEALFRKKKRKPENFDLHRLAGAASDKCTGAEIEKAIDSAMLEGFYHGREFVTEDIVDAFTRFKPLAITRPEVIEQMQVWAHDRCVRANTPDLVVGSTDKSKKDLDI